jgi:hypothetical protein
LGLLVLPVAAGVVVLEVRQAWGACSITWVDQMTCVETNSAGSFGLFTTPLPELTTHTTTNGQGSWVMYMAFTPGNSPHMSTGGVASPTSETITTNGRNVTRTLSGTLTEADQAGIYEFSAWDGTYFNCADAYQFDVLAFEDECDA